MRRDFRLAAVPFSELDRKLYKQNGHLRSSVHPIAWKMTPKERLELSGDVNAKCLSLDEDDEVIAFLKEYTGEEFKDIWRQSNEIGSNYLFIHQHIGSFLRMKKALERAENNRTCRKMKIFIRNILEALEAYGHRAILISS